MTVIASRPTSGDSNSALIEDFRAHEGHASTGPFVGRNLLLLTTIGRKTGTLRTTPLVYITDHDRLVIVASKGGAPSNPAWYLNLVDDPQVTVEVGTETFKALASVAGPAERRRLYDAHAAINPGFREYESRTTREIPVVVLSRVDPASR